MRGSAVRPSKLVIADVTSLPPKRRSIASPSAGLPRDVSSTWVDSRAILSLQAYAKNAERRTGFRKTAEFLCTLVSLIKLRDSIPGPIVRLQMHFSDARDIRKHFGSDLINHLLDASGFEPMKNF